MVCNHGVGSSILPRSTIQFKELNFGCVAHKKYKLVQLGTLQ